MLGFYRREDIPTSDQQVWSGGGDGGWSRQWPDYCKVLIRRAKGTKLCCEVHLEGCFCMHRIYIDCILRHSVILMICWSVTAQMYIHRSNTTYMYMYVHVNFTLKCQVLNQNVTIQQGIPSVSGVASSDHDLQRVMGIHTTSYCVHCTSVLLYVLWWY